MKYILISFLLLVGCGRKFKAGDCIGSQYVESWEKSEITDARIIEVGKYHYHMKYLTGQEVSSEFSEFDYIEAVKVKIECRE